MTRFLSASLQAKEPFFQAGIRRLESANGHPKTDIRISAEVMTAARHKLRQLGLDPKDTTPEELYHVLQSKVAVDDARLTRTLQTAAATHVSAEGNVIDGMIPGWGFVKIILDLVFCQQTGLSAGVLDDVHRVDWCPL